MFINNFYPFYTRVFHGWSAAYFISQFTFHLFPYNCYSEEVLKESSRPLHIIQVFNVSLSQKAGGFASL